MTDRDICEEPPGMSQIEFGGSQREETETFGRRRRLLGTASSTPVRNASSDSMLSSCSTFVVAWSRPNTADGALVSYPASRNVPGITIRTP
jgi:hypothetical protein